MRNTILRLACGFILAAPALPVSASAAQQSAVLHFSTSMTAISESSPYTGSLDLTVAPDGTLQGYYFPSDYSAAFVPVVGGQTGDAIWFDIGSEHIVRVQGRIHDGRIDGGAFAQAGNTSYSFWAAPSAGTR